MSDTTNTKKYKGYELDKTSSHRRNQNRPWFWKVLGISLLLTAFIITAIIFGLLLISFFVCAALPQGLGWGDFIISALKGVGPLVAVLAGVAAFFIGFADIQDKKEARREEKEAFEEAKKSEEND